MEVHLVDQRLLRLAHLRQYLITLLGSAIQLLLQFALL